MHLHPQLGETIGNQGRRSDRVDLGPELLQSPDIRARHPAVRNISDDGDLQPFEALLLTADREDIEERLGRMLMNSIPCIDHAAFEHPGELIGRPRTAVADHDDIDSHSLDVAGRVIERLPLACRAGRSHEIEDVRGEARASELKGGPGPGAGLEKEIDHNPSAQGRHLLHTAGGDLSEPFRGVKQLDDLLRAEILEA